MNEGMGLLENWHKQPLENALIDNYKNQWNQRWGNEIASAYRDGEQANAWLSKNIPGTDQTIDARAGVYSSMYPTYYASLHLPDIVDLPNFYGDINTPLGGFDFDKSDTPTSIEAGFTPKNYYLQALARRIMGTDEQKL